MAIDRGITTKARGGAGPTAPVPPPPRRAGPPTARGKSKAGPPMPPATGRKAPPVAPAAGRKTKARDTAARFKRGEMAF